MKVRLIPYDNAYAPLIMKWREDLNFAEYFRRFPPSMDMCSEQKIYSYFKDAYLIVEEQNGSVSVCGLVGIDNRDFIAKTCEWGILIDPEFCSYQKEVSRQAHHIMFDYIFNTLGMNKAYAKVLPHRTGAIERLKLLGAHVEATLEENFNGQDEVLVAVLKKNYREYPLAFEPDQKKEAVNGRR